MTVLSKPKPYNKVKTCMAIPTHWMTLPKLQTLLQNWDFSAQSMRKNKHEEKILKPTQSDLARYVELGCAA